MITSPKRQRPAKIKKSLSPKERFFNAKVLWFVGLLAFAFALNAVDLYWGVSGAVMWQPDAIEGEMTVSHMPLLFQQWRHKYPRGLYLIEWLFYKPVINHWTDDPVIQKDPTGKAVQAVITKERLCFLAKITRWIVAFMSLGTIIAVFVLTKYLFGDYLAGWMAGFALSMSSLFLFYSGIGHVDLPFTFWFAWACVFAVRAARELKWRDYILAGLCASYAFCTKEGYVGYIPGLAIVYCILRTSAEYQQTHSVKRSMLSIFSLKVLVAAAAFVLLFILMNGGLNFVKEWFGRMEYWRNEPFFFVKRSHLYLLERAGQGLYFSLGWPLLSIVIMGIIYFAFRYRLALALVLIPVLVFYLITVLRTRFVADRFFLPAYVCFAVVAGKTIADWLRFQRIPRFARYVPVVVLCGLTFLFALGLKLEMRNDTRNRVEAWFAQNTGKNVLIGSGMKKWYAPRLKYQGYQLIDGWHSEGVQTSRGLVKVWPDYLLMARIFPCGSNYKDDSAFKEKLYNGQAGYTQVASYTARYFRPSHSIFSIACWPYKQVEWVSPPIDIFKRDPGTSASGGTVSTPVR